MASVRWRGGASPKAQVQTYLFGGTWEATDIIRVQIGSKIYDFTAGSTVIATLIDSLITTWNALSGSTYPEFAEITPTRSTSTLTLTADEAGVPFSCQITPLESDLSAADAQTIEGAGTVTSGTTSTTSTGPEDWSTAANWSGGAVPVAGDAVYIEYSNWDIKYGLSQAGATLLSLDIAPTFTKKIGLPDLNSDNNGSAAASYQEYRTKELTIDCTTVNVECQSSRIRINAGTVQTTLNVRETGNSADTGHFGLEWRGTHASNVVNITKGQVGFAIEGNTTATVATLRVGERDGGDSDVELWSRSTTFTTVEMQSGTVHLETGGTTLTVNGGSLELMAGNWTTINSRSGEIRYLGVGTITTLNVSGGSVVDFSRDQRGRTVTTCQAYEGATIIDPYRTVTWSNGVNHNMCGLGDVTLDLGENIKVTPANL